MTPAEVKRGTELLHMIGVCDRAIETWTKLGEPLVPTGATLASMWTETITDWLPGPSSAAWEAYRADALAQLQEKRNSLAHELAEI